ncbi:hypothetical protein [Bradyrhizobium sp. STM 3809]|uniref:hypothetical protein n=1 Tax=Bradyrhizobium sp. STM 3809 TaxID=551936 RepID=UPI0002408700|nr:hypothetical protein [Bradyrhizobium sp. STM 3809]CCD98968.1 exported hypothetical protein [Bradyrhizobium sp. STM 3809]
MLSPTSTKARFALAVGWAALSLAQISPATACSSMSPPSTEEELFSRASVVFVAHLTSVREIDAPDDMKAAYKQIIEASVQTIEVIKGKPPEDGKLRSGPFGYGNCTLPLLAGADYIFFLQDQNPYITFLTGSAGPILNRQGTEVRKRLEKLRSLAK